MPVGLNRRASAREHADVTAPARRRPARGLLTAAGVLLLAVALLAAGAAFGSGAEQPDRPAAVAPVPSGVEGLQAELRRVPTNHRAWAELGAAYVEQARRSADPSVYAQADGAFAESLRLRPADNDLALAGQAALAAARHAFADALRLADQALAVNAYSPVALAVRVDALTELGQFEPARAALERLLQLRPGVEAFSRASYALELQGDVDGARGALERARDVAVAPTDRAFALQYLGELAWNNGDLPAAAAAYDAALAAAPSTVAALAGRARVQAARGSTEAALADYAVAARTRPDPATLTEYGELLEAVGRGDEAQQQYAVVRATSQLFVANGQVVDAELALFEADHGDVAHAVELAGRAYAARPEALHVQDAYAWALHRAGRDAEALPIARAAVRTGLRLPAFRYHLGAIEAAVGARDAARQNLQAALTLNPEWSPLHAPAARALLAGLPERAGPA